MSKKTETEENEILNMMNIKRTKPYLAEYNSDLNPEMESHIVATALKICGGILCLLSIIGGFVIVGDSSNHLVFLGLFVGLIILSLLFGLAQIVDNTYNTYLRTVRLVSLISKQQAEINQNRESIQNQE